MQYAPLSLECVSKSFYALCGASDHYHLGAHVAIKVDVCVGDYLSVMVMLNMVEPVANAG